ncbi:MAG: hypothetical protein ACYS8W_06235 [Planctomycetota bacterium]|jgi:hypothetical protein
MFTCDICLKQFEPDDFVLVHASVVLACDSYLDYLADYWAKKNIIPKEILAKEGSAAIRNMTRASVKEDVGQSPWLVCEDCAEDHFEDCLTDEAHEQAKAYFEGKKREGFKPPVIRDGKPVEPGPKLLDEMPERRIDLRDGKKSAGPELDEEIEEFAKSVKEEEKKEPGKKAPPEDDQPSADDILKSLVTGAPPPAPQRDDDLTDTGIGRASLTDDDLEDLGVKDDGAPTPKDLEDTDMPLDEVSGDEIDDYMIPGSGGVKEDELEVMTGEQPKSEPEPPPADIPAGHMAVACVCGKQMVVPESYGGRRFRCKTCGATVVIGGAESEDQASEILPLAVEAAGKGDLDSALKHLADALNTSPDSEEAKDFAAMTLYQASQKPDKIDEDVLKDPVFDPFFSECSACGKTWVPNPIAPTGEPTKDGGICGKCEHAYCADCAQEGGEVCRDCGTALVALEKPTGRSSDAPVDTAGLKKILLMHEAAKFAQPDLNRILAEFRPELKIKGIKFALFPMKDWPKEIAQVVAVLASKHAKGTDVSRMRHEVITDPGKKKRLCLVYCYAK